MREKNDKRSLLPDVIFSKIACHIKKLDQKTQSTFSLACKNFQGFFHSERIVNKFLWAIARGRQDLAEKMLKIRPKLLLTNGDVTDYSGRKFSGITALQYLYWALDVRYMTNMMLRCLLDNPQKNKIKKALFDQYERVEKTGLNYTWNGKEYTEKHFDFTPLFQSMRYYYDLCTLCPSTPDILNRREAYWNNNVLNELLNIPAHIAQHYCDVDQKFHPIPNFKNLTLNRTLKFIHWDTQNFENWWPDEDSNSKRKIVGRIRFNRAFSY